MSSGITTLMLAHNLNKIRYPYLASIESVLTISEQVLVIDCDCTDGTIADIRDAFPPSKVQIVPGHWGTHYTVQGEMINLGLKYVQTPWVFQIDADEVLHEKSYDELLKIAKGHHNFTAARPHYIHFSPDFHTTWPFIYENRIRLIKMGHGWRAVGDACDFANGEGQTYPTRTVTVFHYGKVQTGRSKEALVKEWSFQQLYTELGFPDPKVTESLPSGKLDYNHVFSHDKEKGLFQPYIGEHPLAAKPYIELMEKLESIENSGR